MSCDIIIHSRRVLFEFELDKDDQNLTDSVPEPGKGAFTVTKKLVTPS